jgi:hypothetical protein
MRGGDGSSLFARWHAVTSVMQELMKPNFRNLFMKKLTRERVVPIKERKACQSRREGRDKLGHDVGMFVHPERNRSILARPICQDCSGRSVESNEVSNFAQTLLSQRA